MLERLCAPCFGAERAPRVHCPAEFSLLGESSQTLPSNAWVRTFCFLYSFETGLIVHILISIMLLLGRLDQLYDWALPPVTGFRRVSPRANLRNGSCVMKGGVLHRLGSDLCSRA